MNSCASSKSSSRSKRPKGFKSPIDLYCSSTSCEFMQDSRLPSQQTISFATPIYSDFPSNSLQDECVDSPNMSQTSPKLSNVAKSQRKRSSKGLTSRRSNSFKSMSEGQGGENSKEESDCDGEFTQSGSKPAKMTGALGVKYKYAPCGHWDSCKTAGCEPKKNYESCNSCSGRGKMLNLKLITVL